MRCRCLVRLILDDADAARHRRRAADLRAKTVTLTVRKMRHCSLIRLTVAALAVAAACEPQTPPHGIAGYDVVLKESALTTSVTKQVSAACPLGKKALGAGWGVVDSTNAIVDGMATYFEPTFDGAGWLVNARNNSTSFAPIWKLQLRVICADVSA
jgi:hypothetical protein